VTGARLRAAKAAAPAERGRGPRWRPLLAALTLCLTALAAAHARADTAGSAQYDVIVVGSEREKRRLLDVFRKRRISRLPDGRKVEDIILVR